MNSKVHQFLEKDLFNTGPRSSGTFPKESEDEEEKDVTESTGSNLLPPKARRKRKLRPQLGTSPKRSLLNGDSSSNDLPPSSPSPHSFSGLTACSSDSNQSPPRGNSNFRDVPSQTESINFDAIVAADNQRAKHAEEVNSLNKELDRLKREMDKVQIVSSTRRNLLMNLLIDDATRERKRVRYEIVQNNYRIGQFHPTRDGLAHFQDVWTDGTATEELNNRKKELDNVKEEISAEAGNLRKKQRVPKDAKKNIDANISNKDDVFIKPELPPTMTQDYYDRREEILRMRKEFLKKEEADIALEREKLDRDRSLHIREIKRVQNEDVSRFKDYRLLNEKYLPMTLLGKGGFSEVWRAFDLNENRHVACKIHHVNKEWKDNKKVNYVRHAMREKDIHKKLDHPNIVKMYEIFTIDNDSFCTVLEYCDGNDLDFYLKQHRNMGEKETRLVIGQVVDALKYLNELKVPVIHYDLKPANILLQSGKHRFEVKITDFGLSKTVENSEDNDIELTSQGAGTYWYLPPETFNEDGIPKISSKVDVWSVGVICYQCIYGKRPFGHDLTQPVILRQKTILNAHAVNFPAKPSVSQLVQDFIRKCLQYEPANRADVFELARHDFVKPSNKRIIQQPASPSARVIRDDLEH